ncbi:MAG TPA: tetratricopeptide repeat protein [Anaerolineales bacterium]|nr:tetratricopeptide repeat protein [Anaerolineales bacterium]
MSDQPLSSEARFEKFIAVLIALTSIFIAGTAYLEHRASGNSYRFEREAQLLSIQSTTENINGALRFSYDWQGAFQTWRELDLMITNAEQLGETDRAALYRAVLEEIRPFSPLLASPYFDPNFNWPDPYSYEAELYVIESARLQEQFESKSMVSNTWDQIANNFVLQITLYAVALSFFGLSTTIHSVMRWVFVLLGGLIILVNLGGSVLILYVPVDEIPVDAIDSYAHGVGLAYQGHHDEAIDAFRDAIVSYSALPGNPSYTNAYYNKAISNLAIGEYEAAVGDFEATMLGGRVDTTVLWNLGWSYYMLGRFGESVAVNQQALAMNPTLVGLRLNQGLNMLAQGRFENAVEEYRLAVEEAERQIAEARATGQAVPPSLWYFMEAGVFDIQSLIDQAAGSPKSWTQAPAPHLLNVDLDRLQTTGTSEIVRLKEYIVSLEFFGTVPRPPTGRSVSEFAFVREIRDENGNFIDYEDATVNEFGTNAVGVLIDFTGFQNGEHLLWKVYVNGYEDPVLRSVDDWHSGESGSGVKWFSYAFSNVFVFTPGEYTVELYIDTRLMQTGIFTVLPP